VKTAARVLLFVCLLLAMLEQTSVAALRERAGGQRARRTAPTCARARRAVRPPRPARASRPLRFLWPGRRTTDLSATGLTVAGSRSIGAAPALAAVSGVAGAALAAASAVELTRARTHIE